MTKTNRLLKKKIEVMTAMDCKMKNLIFIQQHINDLEHDYLKESECIADYQKQILLIDEDIKRMEGK